ALVLEAGLIPRVRFVQATVEVRHRRAADVLDERVLEIRDDGVTDQRAEPLDSADARECGDDGSRHTLLDEVAGLREVGVGLGPRLERESEQFAAELLGLPLETSPATYPNRSQSHYPAQPALTQP